MNRCVVFLLRILFMFHGLMNDPVPMKHNSTCNFCSAFKEIMYTSHLCKTSRNSIMPNILVLIDNSYSEKY
jgi:hypothetical protein